MQQNQNTSSTTQPKIDITYDDRYVEAVLNTENALDFEGLKDLAEGSRLELEGPNNYLMSANSYKKSITKPDTTTCYSFYHYGQQLELYEMENGGPMSEDDPLVYYNSAVTKKSEYYEANYAYGDLCMKKKDFVKAKELFEKSIETNKEFWPPYIGLGHQYNNDENPDISYTKALFYYDKVLQFSINDQVSCLSYLYQARVLLKLKDEQGKIKFNDSMAMLEKCIAIKPEFKEAYILLADILVDYRNADQNHKQALDYYKKACHLELGENDHESCFNKDHVVDQDSIEHKTFVIGDIVTLKNSIKKMISDPIYNLDDHSKTTDPVVLTINCAEELIYGKFHESMHTFAEATKPNEENCFHDHNETLGDTKYDISDNIHSKSPLRDCLQFYDKFVIQKVLDLQDKILYSYKKVLPQLDISDIEEHEKEWEQLIKNQASVRIELNKFMKLNDMYGVNFPKSKEKYFKANYAGEHLKSENESFDQYQNGFMSLAVGAFGFGLMSDLPGMYAQNSRYPEMKNKFIPTDVIDKIPGREAYVSLCMIPHYLPVIGREMVADLQDNGKSVYTNHFRKKMIKKGDNIKAFGIDPIFFAEICLRLSNISLTNPEKRDMILKKKKPEVGFVFEKLKSIVNTNKKFLTEHFKKAKDLIWLKTQSFLLQDKPAAFLIGQGDFIDMLEIIRTFGPDLQKNKDKYFEKLVNFCYWNDHLINSDHNKVVEISATTCCCRTYILKCIQCVNCCSFCCTCTCKENTQVLECDTDHQQHVQKKNCCQIM